MENKDKQAQELDVDALRREAQKLVKTTEDKVVTSTDASGLIVDDKASVSSYNGMGAVIDATDIPKPGKKGIVVTEMNDQRKTDVMNYMADMDKDIADVKEKIKEETGSVPVIEHGKVVSNAGKVTGPVKDRATSVNIMIDKLGVGKFEFTEDEKKKMTFAKKIKVTEIEEQKFKSIKIRDVKDHKKARTIIERNFDRTLSSIIAPISGYVGKMGNCSVGEIAAIFNITADTNADSIREAWTLIYNKLKYTSLGNFESFDDFIKNTSYDDFEHFVFGILCSSFPEDDKFSFNCKQKGCEKDFEIPYKNSELIRSNEANEECKITILKTIEASNTIESAKAFHKESMLYNAQRISINDDDSVLVDVYAPSVYDVITRIYTDLNKDYLPKDEKDEEANFICALSQKVKAIYLYSPAEEGEEEGSYIGVTDINDIYDILGKKLNKEEVTKLLTYVTNFFGNYYIGYGLPDVVCPNCHHSYGPYIVSPSRMLFQRVQR